VMPAVATASGLRDAATRLRQALDGLAPGAKTVLMHPDGTLPDGASAVEPDGPALLPFPILPVDQLPPAGQDLADSYRVVFDVSHRLGARGCVLVGSDPSSISPRVLRGLIQPVLEQD